MLFTIIISMIAWLLALAVVDVIQQTKNYKSDE
jgi:hypothetical protein